MAADDMRTLSADGMSSDPADQDSTLAFGSYDDAAIPGIGGDTSGDDANTPNDGLTDDGLDASGDADGQSTNDTVPYHKDPAWQRIIKERDEARERAIRAEAIAETMKQQSPPKQESDVPTYKDPAKLSPQELNEWMLENPTDFLANLEAKLSSEIERKLTTKMEQSRTMASVEKTFREYEKNNADFRPMWESGEIKRYMDENPGHNAISAHQVLTAEKRIADAAQRAKGEALEQAQKNNQIKRNARVLGGGPASAGKPAGPDKELSDTKGAGGLNSVLARRLSLLRRGT